MTQNADNLNGATLAYLGDAVIELIVRETIIQSGISDTGRLNSIALKFVRATAQSAGVNKILDHLTENELYVYKRGRNSHGIAIPKSASATEYRRATGLEALFAHLHLNCETERMHELFQLAYSDVIESIKNME